MDGNRDENGWSQTTSSSRRLVRLVDRERMVTDHIPHSVPIRPRPPASKLQKINPGPFGPGLETPLKELVVLECASELIFVRRITSDQTDHKAGHECTHQDFNKVFVADGELQARARLENENAQEGDEDDQKRNEP
jgi:hypothetical protein